MAWRFGFVVDEFIVDEGGLEIAAQHITDTFSLPGGYHPLAKNR
jgi:hypothetical protein